MSTTTTTFVGVKSYQRPIGKKCMHCGRPATVTATRKSNGFRLAVRYCDEHAAMRGAVKEAA